MQLNLLKIFKRFRRSKDEVKMKLYLTSIDRLACAYPKLQMSELFGVLNCFYPELTPMERDFITSYITRWRPAVDSRLNDFELYLAERCKPGVIVQSI